MPSITKGRRVVLAAAQPRLQITSFGARWYGIVATVTALAIFLDYVMR